MLAISPAFWLMVAGSALGGGCDGQAPEPDRPSAEARAVAFLVREVPRWSRENHCFSCHNNGDAARALYEATRVGLGVPGDTMADTTAWLTRPSGWDNNGGEGPFSDKRLARVAFTSALAAATRTGANRDRAALGDAAPPAGAATRPTTAPGPSKGRNRQARRRPTAACWPPSWPARASRPPTRTDSGPPSIAPTVG